jgi:hypothetical protein
VIYTDTEWWKKCTGDYPTFGSLNPLWINNPGNSVGTLPSGWKSYTFWQHAESGPIPVQGRQDYYNGDLNKLKQWVAFVYYNVEALTTFCCRFAKGS